MKTTIPNATWWVTCFAEQLAEQDWLRTLQQQELAKFMHSGFPNRKQERWKYTDVTYLQTADFKNSVAIADDKVESFAALKRLQEIDSIFVVLINGHYSAQLSETSQLPAGVILCSIKQALTSHPDLIKLHLLNNSQQDSAFKQLNTALMTDGIFLYIPKNITINMPIHLLYVNAHQDHFVSSPRNLIIAEANSQATILEEHFAQAATNYFTNMVTDIHAEQSAQIYYHKIQAENSLATHVSQIFVSQKKDSTVKICGLAVGGRLSREDVFVNLNEPGASASVNGFYIVSNDNQHLDNHIQIDHLAPHGTSEMMFKGVLDKKSHGVFNGKVLVHPDAQKTYSQQANHNLLLSTEAAIDTKPELEIYADDVKCSHGDTVGQLDTEALFYLRSRGIDKHTALKILTYAFATDVMNRITHTVIRQRMIVLLKEKLDDES